MLPQILAYITRIELDQEAEGQGMVEYALILVLVSIAAIAALTLLGPQIAAVFGRVTEKLAFV